MQEINDEDLLLRRVPFTDPNYIREDGSITSFAFTLKKNEDGLSVDIDTLTTHDKSVLDRTKFRLYGLKAGVPREAGLACVHDPVEGNYAHALIKGAFTKSVSRMLASKAGRVA
jgi:hypothetical protein